MSESALVTVGGRKRSQAIHLYGIFSVMLHVGGFAILVWVSPCREFIFGQLASGKAETALRSDRVAKIAERIEEVQKDMIWGQVGEMLGIEEELLNIEDRVKEQYSKFAAVFAAVGKKEEGGSKKPGKADARDEQRRAHPGKKGNVGRLDIVDLYGTAVEAEKNITKSFRNIRATQLAMLTRIRVEQAMLKTDMPLPVRPELCVSVLRNAVRTGESLEEQKQAVKMVVLQTSSMVVGARLMRDVARNITEAGGDEEGITVEHIAEMSEYNSIMDDAAFEDELVNARDLTGMMIEWMRLLGEDPGVPGIVVVDTSWAHPQVNEFTPHVIPGRKVNERRCAGELDVYRQLVLDRAVSQPRADQHQ